MRFCAAVSLFVAACGSTSGGSLQDAPLDAPDAPLDAPSGTPDAPSDGSPDAAPDAGAPDAVIDAPPADGSIADMGVADAGVCGDLRLWYRFEETTGMTYDSSGCGNIGAPSNVTRGEVGRMGNAYLFNTSTTTTAHVLVPDAPSLGDLGMLTVEAWVRHTGGILEAVLNHGNAMGGDPFIFHTFTVRDPAITLGFYPDCTGMGSAPGSVPLPVDAWTHIAATVNNFTAEILYYTDGVQSGSGTGYMNMGHMCDNAEPMIVGGIDTAGAWGWEGWIDELRVWAVLRTQAEICTDAGGTPGPGTCTLPP